ncbi:hypothetical protein CAPTEDRAFT_109138, partial [Capitella teleta]
MSGGHEETTEVLADLSPTEFYKDNRRRRLIGSETWGFKFGAYLNFFWLSLVIAIGWIGNALTFAVFSQPKNRVISCCVYMCGLAISDMCMMTVATHYIWRYIQLYVASNEMKASYVVPTLECKLVVWLHTFAAWTGTCIIICMTVDRLIGVRFPLLAKRLCSTRRAKWTLAFIPFVTGVYTIPHFMYA